MTLPLLLAAVTIATPAAAREPATPSSPSSHASACLDPGEVPVGIGGDVSAPVPIHQPSPKYPKNAKEHHVEGIVVADLVIDRCGKVTDVKVRPGADPLLLEGWVNSLRKWRFEPARRDGQPVAVVMMFSSNFTLRH